MSFAEFTGNTRLQPCPCCRLEVTFEEFESWNRNGHTFLWCPAPHRAPCGAHCAAGSYEHGETDVHVPFRGTCPRCGAIDSEDSDI